MNKTGAGEQNNCMSKKKNKKMLKKVFEGSVCATECTGLVQHVSVDDAELKRFNKEFNKK
jgi:hypothetical protein